MNIMCMKFALLVRPLIACVAEAVSDIHKVRKRRLIVITSTPFDSEVRMNKKQTEISGRSHSDGHQNAWKIKNISKRTKKKLAFEINHTDTEIPFDYADRFTVIK